MDKNTHIKKLLDEADNAKAWFAKYTAELEFDPTNKGFLRLQELCIQEFEKRWDELGDLGVSFRTAEGVIKRPRIDE